MKKCNKCKQDKNLYEFAKNKSQPDGIQSICKECRISYDKKTNSNKILKIKNILSDFRRELGGKCVKCNENREHLLDFHHIKPEEKEDVIANILSWNGIGKNSIKKARDEMNKCILLCSNCHRDFHYLERNKNININQYLI